MRRHAFLLALLAIAFLAWCGSALAAEEKPLWVVVTTPALEPALKPLVEKRTKDGFETVVSTKAVDKALAGLPRKPSLVLIVGDYELGKEQQGWFVAAKRMKFYRWRAQQPQDFASDAAFGDLDGDLVPDVPVGRIPARTREEATLVVKKILAYEKSEPGIKSLRLPIWTGASGYGPLIDGLASSVLMSKTQMGMPSWSDPVLICADPRLPFCGWPPDQPTVFNRELKQGCLMAAMMGHADKESFSAVLVGNKVVKYALGDAETGLAQGDPTGPVFIFACSTADFTGPRCCLAEMMLGSPGGPVAVVGAVAESHPLPNYFSGVSFLDHLGENERRIGVLWLKAQRDAMKARDPMIEGMLADVEGKLEAQINVGKLKRDQILIYEILGDPATPLFLPQPLEATVERTGSGWHWKAKKPDGAKQIQVGFRPEIPVIKAGSASAQPDQMRKAFVSANEGLAYASLDAPKPGAAWEGDVSKPGFVRLVATGPGVFSATVLRLKTEPDSSAEPTR